MPYITRRTFFTARPPKRYGVILSITLLTALFFHEHAHKNRRFHTKFHPHDNHPIVLVVAISNLNDTLSPANKTSNYPVDGLDSVQIQQFQFVNLVSRLRTIQELQYSCSVATFVNFRVFVQYVSATCRDMSSKCLRDMSWSTSRRHEDARHFQLSP